MKASLVPKLFGLLVALWAVPALAQNTREKQLGTGGVGVQKKQEKTSTGVGACKHGDHQPHLSLADRVMKAEVVFYGFVTRVYKKKKKATYPAEFFIVNVFKGSELVAKLLKVEGGYGGVYNLRDKRINVTNFGPREDCLSPLEEQRTFIILATYKSGRRLRAHYDHPGSAAVQWSKENEEIVWSSLGWDGWSDWSGCSASCDGGTQERRRYCLHSEGCQGYNTERRRCNFFSCNGTLDVLHLHDKRYKPNKFGWRESSTRPGSWRAVRNRPLLVHTRDIYPGGFPKEFSLLITVRPDLGNMGMLFIMHRAYGGEVYLGLGLGTGLELLHTGPTREDDVLPINVAPINVNLTDGHWHQLAISVLEDNSIQVYVDCRWISRQILRRSTLEIPIDTLLYVGGMPGRSYQGEMEQFTISGSPDAVAKQCKPEPIPIIDKTLQDIGRPLGLAIPEYSNHNAVLHTDDSHHYDSDAAEYDYRDYGDNAFEPYNDVEYNEFPDYVYDDYEDFEDGRVSSTHELNAGEDFIVTQEGDVTLSETEESEEKEEREEKRTDMKEMSADAGGRREQLEATSAETDDEDLVEGSGAKDHGKFELMWSVWSGCSTSCDGGVRIRSYSCVPNQLFLEECVRAGIETQQQRACNLQPCPSTTTPRTTTTTTSTTTAAATTTTTAATTTSTSRGISGASTPEMDNMIQSIPYMTSTDTFSPPPVTATPLHQFMTVTSTPSSPTTSTRPSTTTSTTTTRTKVVEMHPLFPTTLISPDLAPVSETSHNDSAKVYPDKKPHKVSKMDDNSVWKTMKERDMNEVLPRGGPPPSLMPGSYSKRMSWNHKWSYQYHHHHHHHNHNQQPHRMRHHHTKHSAGQDGEDCAGGCLNQGLCGYGGVCHCARGWTGLRCQTPECARGCINGGVCTAPDTCRCPPGYSGALCQHALCSPACSNGGTCVIPGLCVCPAGYVPPLCAPMCTARCLHGGECTGVERCTCPGGYTGARCESAVCTPSCQHGGLCVAPGVCSCTPGYGGSICQRPVCRPPCQHGGTCLAPYLCRCPAGTLGTYCQNFLCSRGCGVGGVCVGVERCRCGQGYTGPSCTVAVCDPPCSNGGTCTSPGVCSCPEGFSGLWCTNRKCKYVPKQVAYTRSYKKLVPQRVETHCGAWGWKSCTSVRQNYQTVTQKFYRTVYTCEPLP
nr:uncharacterized protein LOC123767108 isoform X2 [Procambarus clarkii]